jgi:hypothetical protein
MSTCKAIIQDGPRKGQSCIPVTTIDSDGYCTKHQRQKEYDILTSQGKRFCRFFFRGCNSEISQGTKTCKVCLDKKKKSPCSHVYENGKQCTYEILNDTSKYCGKHQRDDYRDYEKDHQVKVCNIERGCMNICEPEYQSCKSCIINNYIVNDRYYSDTIENKRLCIVCEQQYEEQEDLCSVLKRCEQCCIDFMAERKTKKVVQQRAYSDMTIEKYYESYIRGAYKREVNCEFHLSLSEFTSLVTKPCFYCSLKDSVSFNGIDRVDNNGHYTTENTVPCCSVCNRLKHSMNIGEFLNKCYAIQSYLTHGSSITKMLFDKYPQYQTLSLRYYSDYKKSNDEDSSRQLEFTLTKSEFNSIRTNPCYLCGIENSDTHYNGIDRVNNSKGYISSNCKACCGHCNFFKANIPIGIVKFYVQKIVENPSNQTYRIPILPIQTGANMSEVEGIETCDSSSIDTITTSRFLTKELAALFQKDCETILAYCTDHERSHTFMRNVKKLYETKVDMTIEEIHVSLIRFVNADKNKTYSDKKDPDANVKQHKKANEVLTMLEQGKLKEYLEWHNQHVGNESTVFRKHLEEFMCVFQSLKVSEKLERCKKILKQEQTRRGAKRAC